MAARKKSTKSGRSKQSKSVPSKKRSRPGSRAAKARPRKAASKASRARKTPARKAAAAKRPAPAKKKTAAAERREGTHQGKPTPKGGAKKTLDREMTALAVDATSNGTVVDAKLQTKSPQKSKSQSPGQEFPLKVEKIEPATAVGTKATEGSVDSAAASKPAAASGGKQKSAARDEAASAPKSAKATGQRQGFKLSEFVVYPAHGVGQIVAIEEQEVAGFKLELFVISFSKDKMTLRVPTSKVAGVGMRKISDPDTAKRSLDILSGRARVKRTMWSRRAQEYETKINSGDITAIAEVVRDLFRSEAQPEQSYSERQLYEAALDRMVREIAAVQKSNEIDALKAIEAQLQKTHARQAKAGGAEVADPEIEEAA
jgi:CarD family transcriptional regulator